MGLNAFLGAITACLLLCVTNSARAQANVVDLDSPQITGLFEGACMRFVGNVAEQRNWAASRKLPLLPFNEAAEFLGEAGFGQVFGASTASGKHVLVSFDNGSCEVIAMSADATAVRQMLLARLGMEGVYVTPILERSSPSGDSVQKLYRGSNGPQRWQFSITAKRHGDAPTLPPELRLLATTDPR